MDLKFYVECVGDVTHEESDDAIARLVESGNHTDAVARLYELSSRLHHLAFKLEQSKKANPACANCGRAFSGEHSSNWCGCD